MEETKSEIALRESGSPSRLQPLVAESRAEAQPGTERSETWLGLAWGGFMLLTGTCCTLSAKALFNTKAEGLVPCEGSLYCTFGKPWFTVFVMKCGMSCCLFFHFAMRSGSEPGASASTLLKISLPSVLDLLNVLLSNVGLLWVSSSIYQMTRGSLVVFSAILTVQLLRRRLLCYQYWAVSLVTMAVILVGIAGILGSDASAGTSTVTQIVAGLLLILAAQVVLAYQIVVEERMMTEDGVTPFQLTGYEGLWGLLYFVVLVPVLTLTPGNPNPDKPPSPMLAIYHEDFWDTLVKLSHSGQLVFFSCLFFVVVAAYNLSGQMVTKYLSAVLRSILEACRTLGVWLVDLLLFYVVGAKDDGEAWTVFSWMELAGFMLLVYGTMSYKGLAPIPCAPKPAAASATIDGIPRANSAPSATSSWIA